MTSQQEQTRFILNADAGNCKEMFFIGPDVNFQELRDFFEDPNYISIITHTAANMITTSQNKSGIVCSLDENEYNNLSGEIQFIDNEALKPEPVEVTMPNGEKLFYSLKKDSTAEQIAQDLDPDAVFLKKDRRNFLKKIIKQEPLQLHLPIPSINSIMGSITPFFINGIKYKPCAAIPFMYQVTTKARDTRLAQLQENPVIGCVSLLEPKPEYINIPIIINSTLGFDDSVSTISFKISSSFTADKVMEELISRTKRHSRCFDFELGDLCFHVPGTNEVISGQFEMYRFAVVQNFIYSGQTMLKLNVIKTCDLETVIPSVSQTFIEHQRNLSVSSRSSRTGSSCCESFSDDGEVETINPTNYTSKYSMPQSISIVPPLDFEDEIEEPPLESFRKLPHSKAFTPLSVTIEGIKVDLKNTYHKLAVSACLKVGRRLIEEEMITEYYPTNSFVTIGMPIQFATCIARLPRYACICFTIYNKEKSDVQPIAYVSLPLFDRNHYFNSGRHRLGLFPASRDLQESPPTPVSNISGKVRLFINIDFPFPVFFELDHSSSHKIEQLTPEEEATAKEISKLSPLMHLTNDQIQFLIDNRWKIVTLPEILPIYLSVLDFSRVELISELPVLLNVWAPLTGPRLLSILGPDFIDPSIRSYVVNQLESWSDANISLFLLQLTEALQYEPEDDSQLALFLLRRAILEPKYLGLQFFWQLRSMAAIPWFAQRALNLTVMLVGFNDPVKTEEYMMSYYITDIQRNLCKKYCHGGQEGLQQIRDTLQSMPFPGFLQLPIDPKIVVSKYIPEKTKIMDSAKKPLIITFGLADPFTPRNISMMMKMDDDLRQDQLVLQLFKVMDFLWKENGLNMRLTLYSVLPTGVDEGMIEIVSNSVTISSLQKEFAGKLIGAFSSKYVLKWLTQVNDGQITPKIMENYKYSLAGYCVATYVMGIGDRHCSNMMIQNDGHFFHIDFGHFLGHFKKKLGINRENKMFYLSDALVYVLGDVNSDQFKDFVRICGEAYNVLRRNSHLLIHIVLLMLGTGIPELKSVKDVEWLQNALALELTEEEAAKHFEELIQLVLASSKSTINDFFHLQAH